MQFSGHEKTCSNCLILLESLFRRQLLCPDFEHPVRNPDKVSAAASGLPGGAVVR
jgi:hypothetical protein